MDDKVVEGRRAAGDVRLHGWRLAYVARGLQSSWPIDDTRRTTRAECCVEDLDLSLRVSMERRWREVATEGSNFHLPIPHRRATTPHCFISTPPPAYQRVTKKLVSHASPSSTYRAMHSNILT